MYYNFRDALTDCRSVVHLIGMHGPNLIGLELGVDTAQSHVTLLQNCPNIKKLYGIDNPLESSMIPYSPKSRIFE